jgi:hypothetical protein
MADGDTNMGAADAGNYKGVMLCNRPTEPTTFAGPQHLKPSMDAPSFRPVGLPSEPLGLNPAKENLVSNILAVHDEAARRRADNPAARGTNFMNKHRAWLAEMAQKKAALNAELQESAIAAEQKRKKFVAYTKSLRTAVRERAAQMEFEGIEHAEPQLMKGVRTSAVEAPPPPTPPPPAPPAAKPKPKPGASSSKPAWAMTETEADEFEDEEASLLVEFAKDLDYDSYIDDLEVRQALGVIRERIDAQKAVEAAAAAADEADEKIAAAGGDWRAQFLSEWNGREDDDGASQRTGASRRAPIPAAASGDDGEQPEWDASTNAGDRDQGRYSSQARAMAEELLRENPELGSKHSIKSLTSMVSKAQHANEPQAGASMTKTGGWERSLTEAELPPLRVVTVVENPRVPTKDVDPSNLPYLHRNPAI